MYDEIMSRVSLIHAKMQNFWRSLALAQKFYFSALFLFLFWLIFIDSNSRFVVFIAGCLGLYALLIEVMPKFTWLWNTLVGKGVLLIVYGIVANVALVISNQIINQVVGIDPSELFYTQSLTALFSAPLWILFVSCILMLVYVLLLNVALLILMLLRLLRLKVKFLDERESYPALTILVRLVISPVIFYTLGSIMSLYSNDIFRIETDASEVTVQMKIEENSEDLPDSSLDFQMRDADNIVFENFIAGFVYYFETFPLSQCVKSEDERVKLINEEDILVAREDPESDTGYQFTVRKCKLKEKDPDAH